MDLSGRDLQTATTRLYLSKGNRMTGRSRRRRKLMDYDDPRKILTFGPRTLRRFILGTLEQIVASHRITPTTPVDDVLVRQIGSSFFTYITVMFEEHGHRAIRAGLTRRQEIRMMRVTGHYYKLLQHYTRSNVIDSYIHRTLIQRQQQRSVQGK